jgi:tRNA uracil 4-sulfurtransferase
MGYDGLLVHYAELATKGRNRSGFVRGLASNIRRALADGPIGGIDILSGRLWVYPRRGAELPPELVSRLSTIIGVANYAPAKCVPVDMEAIKACALELVRDRVYESFRVRARRVFKQLPLGSFEVDREVGAYLVEHKPAKVQMKEAALEVHVEMLPQGAFVYVDRRQGPGGLPVGMSGLVACLLSGGIDSPVAAYRMQRRGCKVVFIHFHSQPYLNRASVEKATELAKILSLQQGGATLHLVPLGELQREIVIGAPQALRVVLYRRFMVRIAAAIARRAGAKALVTGEALGQVASQTLTNLVVIDDAAPMTVLRPLIGFDKQEIIDAATRLGTFEISITPDQDCCQLFTPRAPETHAKVEEIQTAEAKLDIARLCDDALARTQQVVIDAEGRTHAGNANRGKASGPTGDAASGAAGDIAGGATAGTAGGQACRAAGGQASGATGGVAMGAEDP